DDHGASITDLRVAAGAANAGIAATIGAAPDSAATLSYGSLLEPRPARIVVPVRGHVSSTPVAPAVIDDARFALRADGDLTQRTRVSGEIIIDKAHVPRAALSKAASGSASGSASPKSTRPELARVDLDLTARSHGGAVDVDLPGPDLHVDVDYRITGTAA